MTIHLRQRKHTSTGKTSLYLDVYKGTTSTANNKRVAKREYIYLDLYLIDKPKTAIERQKNKETLKLAETIKAQKEVEIKNGIFGFTSGIEQNANFIDYFNSLMGKKDLTKKSIDVWKTTIKHLVDFSSAEIKIKEVDKTFCANFLDYLTKVKARGKSTPLSSKSVWLYFAIFKGVLNQVVADEIILKSPAKNIKIPKVIEKERRYLTLEELQKLSKTDCKELVKRTFMFSCLTGLRVSDIVNLRWSNVQDTEEGQRITFNQQKTKGLQYLDISKQATQYLGKKGLPNDKVFTGFTYTHHLSKEIRKWVKNANINKDITFHCARHTFATLQYKYKTDIYTLSKLLGHADIQTTQIYAKIMDENKRNAVNRIPNIDI